jgi:hypothetical protein
MMEAGLERVAEGRLSGQWEAAVRREAGGPDPFRLGQSTSPEDGGHWRSSEPGALPQEAAAALVDDVEAPRDSKKEDRSDR